MNLLVPDPRSSTSLFEIKKPKALLFDCDGLLSDTESSWNKVLFNWLSNNCLDTDNMESFVGVSLEDAATRLSTAANKPYEEVKQQLLVPLRAELAGEIPVMPGAVNFVTLAKERFPIALVTNNHTNPAKEVLAKIGLADVFPVVVGVNQVSAGKPEPFSYQRAAELLGFDAGDCVALEDSALGSLAATRAGSFVIGVNPHSETELNCHVRYHSLEDTELLSWLTSF